MPTTDQQRPIFVIPPSPRLKTHRPSRRYKGPHLFSILLLLLALFALGSFLFTLHTHSTPSTASQSTPIDCNALLQSNDYTKGVDLQPGEQMGAIEPASQLTGGSPAELVQVMHSDAQHTLDVYLFGCTIHQNKPELTTLLAQRGLVNGTVEISQAHTLITGTLDTSLSPDASALLMPAQQYINREFAYQNGAFQQVMFPGFYPVASRAEAEALQQQADNGQSVPWSDPLTTAEAMAKDILGWSATGQQATLVSSDSTTAQVTLTRQNPPLTLNVTLEKLVQQDSKGLWFVVAAHTQGITAGLNGQDMTALPQQNIPLLSSQPQTPLQLPIALRGTGALADGQTSATLFDHTLSPASSASSVALQVNSDGTYSGSLSYPTLVPGQEGVLLIESLPQSANYSIERGQILVVPVLLG
jgi:hypothetical protein